MRLIVVRHGTAKAKRSWKGLDSDRPLTAGGSRQAQAIAKRLRRDKPTHILSSPSLRCLQTVQPLATAAGLDLTVTAALATDGGRAGLDLATAIAAANESSSTIVLCTHRELIVDLLPHLVHQTGVKLPHRLPGAKGGCWTVQYRRGRLVSVKYWSPGL
jgi:8-oxo-dGTP diphosphatase